MGSPEATSPQAEPISCSPKAPGKSEAGLSSRTSSYSNLASEAGTPSASSEPGAPLQLVQPLRPVPQAHLDEVRAQLSEEENAECDDATVARYVRATGGTDLKLAAKRLRDTLEWRRREAPERMECTACAANPKSHYMHVIGHDMAARPVIYSCLELATNRDVQDNRRHMLSTFEQAIRLMPPGVESWCWVLDFHGFGVRDCDPRLAKIFLTETAAHYPERLGQFFVISAPRLFNGLWKAISGFIDPVTKQKIHFCQFSRKGGNEKVQALLLRHFDPETATWLMNEMAENREKALALSKAYSYQDLAALAHGPGDASVALAAERRRTSGGATGHDHLGTPRMLSSLGGKPELLLPHLQALRLGDEQGASPGK